MKIRVCAVDTDDTGEFEAQMVVWAADGGGELHVYEGDIHEADEGRLVETALFARRQWRVVRLLERPDGRTENSVWRDAQREAAKQFET